MTVARPGSPRRAAAWQEVQLEEHRRQRYRAHLVREHNGSLDAIGLSAGRKLNDYTVALNGHSAFLTRQEVEALRSQKNVLKVMKDELRQPLTDSSPGFLVVSARVGAASLCQAARVAIPPDAVDDAEADLDVYVYNPAGQQVASSTLGGTDEEVTIQDPADGRWTVYVHGWQAPGGDTNYNALQLGGLRRSWWKPER